VLAKELPDLIGARARQRHRSIEPGWPATVFDGGVWQRYLSDLLDALRSSTPGHDRVVLQ
jgi:hypothetical protein